MTPAHRTLTRRGPTVQAVLAVSALGSIESAGVGIAGYANGHSVPYHPASQYWPLQLTFLTIALTLAAALLASGWYATRTRAI